MTIEKYYDKVIETCLDVGEKRTSKLQEHQRLLELYGLTGLRIKHFLNALLSQGKLNYLEMGVYRGASLACGLYKNPEVKTYAVDNWHYSPIDHPAIKFELDKEGKPTSKTIPFPNVKMAAQENIQKFAPGNKVIWVEKNFKDLKKSDIPDAIDIVHLQCVPGVSKIDLKAYLNTLYPLLAVTSVIVMEDYMNYITQEVMSEWIAEKKMTLNSLRVKKSDSAANGDHWWGGLGVYVLTKEEITK